MTHLFDREEVRLPGDVGCMIGVFDFITVHETGYEKWKWKCIRIRKWKDMLYGLGLCCIIVLRAWFTVQFRFLF